MRTARDTNSDSRTARLARAATPWGFPVVYLGWTYLFWLPVVRSGDPVWSFPNAALFLVGGASPLLAGLGLLWLTRGRDGYRDLYRRLVDVGRIGRRWGLVVVLFYPVFTVLVGALLVALGVHSHPLEVVSRQRLLEPVSVVALVAVALVFPTIEEIGLRGYWFDQLQVRFSALGSSLILGVVWAAWHVPLVYVTGYYDETTFEPALWWWLPSIVLTAVVGTWIYNNTRRSVLAVIGLHFFGNLTGELAGFAPGVHQYALVGTAAVVIGLLVVWGPTSLCGWNQPRPTAEPVVANRSR